MNRTCLLLTVIAAMERFAFKGVACNLVVYLTDVVKMGNSSAVKTVNTWCGVTTMLPLFVAPLADSYWNHYTTIFISSSFYALGLTALTLTAVEWSRIPAFSGTCLFWSLSVVSLAQATCNSSLQAFAADQLYSGDEHDDHDSDKKMATKSVFFQWWYVGICGGSLLGVTVMSYLQDRVGWDVGFAVPAAAMVAAVVLFTSRRHCYTYKHESSRAHFPTSWKKILASLFRPHNPIAAVEIQMEAKPLQYAKEEEEEEDEDEDEEEEEEKIGNREGRICMDVEKIKMISKLVPIWMTLLPFAIIFQLPTTYFTKQGATMERRIGGFVIPPAMLQAAITVSIIVLTPLYNKVLVPMMKEGVSVMERMGIGMVLTVVAMGVAAEVEGMRMRAGRRMGREEGEVVEMSILWLLPQYVLLGVSDVFTVVGMQEFFYRWAPEGMKTTGIAMYTSVFGMGGVMGAVVVALVEGATRGEEGGWLAEDMVGGGGRLDKYYGLLGGVSAVSLVFYLGLCRWLRAVLVVTPSVLSSCSV